MDNAVIDYRQLQDRMLLASIVESSCEAITSITADGIILSWNAAAEQLYGHLASEAVGQHFSVVVPAERREAFARLLDRVCDGETVTRMETMFLRKGGGRLSVAVSAFPIQDDSGAIIGVSAIHHDVTEAQRSEARLRAELQVTRILAEASNASSVLPRVLAVLGPALDCQLAEFWAPEGRPSALGRAAHWAAAGVGGLRAFADERGTREIQRGEGLIGRAWQNEQLELVDLAESPDRDGASRAGMRAAAAFPVIDREGFRGVTAFFGSRPPDWGPELLSLMSSVGLKLGNFIRRRKAEAERDRLAAIVAASADAIVGWDVAGRITSWNPGAQRMYGYSAEEAIGQPLSMLVPADRRDSWIANIEEIKRGRSFEQYETKRVRKDGSLVDVSLTVSPIMGEGGRVVAICTIARDISDKRREAELRQRITDELRHRLKNVLSMVVALNNLSRRHFETVDAFAESVTTRVQSLARLYDYMGRFGGERAQFDQIVTLCLEPYREVVDAQGPAVEISSDEAVSLGLVLHELTTNAAKYGALSAEGGRVQCHWSMAERLEEPAEGHFLELRWRERGGPEVRAPSRTGLGSLLMRQSIEYGLRGKFSLEFAPDGLRCDILVPVVTTVEEHTRIIEVDADESTVPS